ncbi:MAG: CoA-binding protein [Deltaproteobacteria bacterium]|nr:CoA-binding protein [Deltaproteobacteria bacterium]
MKVDFKKLDRAFNPRSLVVVGASKQNEYQWLSSQLTFKGKLYSVAVNPQSIEDIKAMGVTNYTSLLDVPEPIDLVIVAVPRAIVPQVLDDCIRKNVAGVHMFTAGFSETEMAEGIEAEKKLKAQAEAANLQVIGPNCMGLYNAMVGIRQFPEQPVGMSGALGVISQSGGHAINFSLDAYAQGLYINKSASFGNGTLLDSADFLEYFAQDPEIKAVAMYLEGVKDGRRFLKVLKEASLKKPVIIWKGGRTEEGSFAIASHTGSMAVPLAVWDAVIRQHGGISVPTMDDLIDTAKALIYMPPITGIRVAVTGGSGGQSVNIADAFAEVGLRLPALTEQSYDKLREFYSIVGGGFRNPVDTGNQNRFQMKRIIDILAQDTNIDNVVLLSLARFIMRNGQLDDFIEMLADARDSRKKPVMSIIASSNNEDLKIAAEASQRFQDKGIPVFPSIERGARAMRNAYEYYRLKTLLMAS